MCVLSRFSAVCFPEHVIPTTNQKQNKTTLKVTHFHSNRAITIATCNTFAYLSKAHRDNEGFLHEGWVDTLSIVVENAGLSEEFLRERSITKRSRD